MKKIIEYDALILRDGNNDISYTDIPFNVEQTFGKKRVKIKAMMDAVEYRGLLTPMGGRYFLLIRKDLRAQIGKTFGETIHVTIEEDTEPRIVEVPEAFALKMEETGVRPFFDKLSFTHQKEYVRWITEAKREETRQARFVKAIEMLQVNKKTPV